MWNLCPAHRDEPLDLRHVQHRHDSGDDRLSDPHRPGLVTEAVEILVIKEELCDHKITAGVNLALQVLQVARAVEALRMPFRIARHADAKIVTIPGKRR